MSRKSEHHLGGPAACMAMHAVSLSPYAGGVVAPARVWPRSVGKKKLVVLGIVTLSFVFVIII